MKTRDRLIYFDSSKTHLELYNVINDPTEKHDVSDMHPDIMAEMKAILKKEHIHNNDFPFDRSE